jgi:hypothetical protein
MSNTKSKFKENFGVFSIIFFIAMSYPLAVASLNPEFWKIETTWIFRSAIYASFLSLIGFILSLINWKMIKNS